MASFSASDVIGKGYLLHLHDKSLEEQTSAQIAKLEGTVEAFLTNKVNVVVTDYTKAANILDECKKNRRCSSCARRYGTDNSQNSCSTSTTEPSDFATIKEESQPNSIVATMRSGRLRRGQFSDEESRQSNVPILLREAHQMGIKIITYSDFAKALKTQERKSKIPIKISAPAAPNRKVIRLYEPFVKVEDRSRQYRPHVERLDRWPKINLAIGRRGCVFARDMDKEKAVAELPSSSSSVDLRPCSPKKRRKAARKLNFDAAQLAAANNTGSEGLTLTAESKHYDSARRDSRPGLCELCNIRADNITEHLASSSHQKNATSNLYQSLDEEIAKGPTLEQFLADAMRQAVADSRGGSSLMSPKRPSLVSPRPSPRRTPGRKSTTFASPAVPQSPLRPTTRSITAQSPSANHRSPFHSPKQQSIYVADSESPFIAFENRRIWKLNPLTTSIKTDLSVLRQ